LITFTIPDGGLLGDSFALAWAMTCANDVIQGPVVLRAGQDFPTPLPASGLAARQRARGRRRCRPLAQGEKGAGDHGLSGVPRAFKFQRNVRKRS